MAGEEKRREAELEEKRREAELNLEKKEVREREFTASGRRTEKRKWSWPQITKKFELETELKKVSFKEGR